MTAEETAAEDNASIVRQYVELLFTRDRAREACERYLHEDCIQHSPNIGDGREAVIAFARELFDLFRVVDGRIVEHWDAVQQIPEQAANAHPMF